jgi:hypothetical protein
LQKFSKQLKIIICGAAKPILFPKNIFKIWAGVFKIAASL